MQPLEHLKAAKVRSALRRVIIKIRDDSRYWKTMLRIILRTGIGIPGMKLVITRKNARSPSTLTAGNVFIPVFSAVLGDENLLCLKHQREIESQQRSSASDREEGGSRCFVNECLVNK